MNPRHRNLLVGLVVAAILIVGSLWILHEYARRSLRPRVQRGLPENAEFESVGLGLFPPSLLLRGVSLKSGGRTVLRVPSVELTPTWETWTGGTVEFTRIAVYSPRFDLRLGPDVRPFPGAGSSLLVPSNTGPNGSLPRIDRVSVVDGRLRLYRGTGSDAPWITLTSVHGQARGHGAQTTISLRGGVGDAVDRWRFKARYGPSDTPPLSGHFTLRDLPAETLPRALIPGLHLKRGHLKGEVPFHVDSGGVGFGQIFLTLSGAHVRAGKLPSKPTPNPVNPALPPVEAIYLEVKESRVGWGTKPGGEIGRSVDLRWLQLRTGSLSPGKARVPFRAVADLAKPAGTLQAEGDLEFDPSKGPRVRLLVSGATRSIEQLNPYLGDAWGFHFARGRLRAAARGTVSAPSLDLEVQLNFKRTKLRAVGSKNEKFLKIPTTVLIDYLSQKKGELDLTFTVGGTPSEPRIDTTNFQQKLLVRLGVDAAVLATLGLPALAVDQVLKRTTGTSLLGEASSLFQNLFEPAPLKSPGSDTPARLRGSPSK